VDPIERGFAVAAVRALGARAEAACGRRSPALRRLAAQLARDPALLAEEAKRLDAPVPDGLAEVHASWYEAPPPSSRDDARAHLERRAYGRLVPMTPRESDGGLSDRLETASAGALAELIEAMGRRRVAVAFAATPRTALAQLCARLGEPAAAQLLETMRKTRASSDEVKSAQRALLHLDAPADALFLRAGAAWLGPALAQRGAHRLRRVAQRLPRAIGELLLMHAEPEPSEAEAAATFSVAVALLALGPARD
jgi:hypothetical protein